MPRVFDFKCSSYLSAKVRNCRQFDPFAPPSISLGGFTLVETIVSALLLVLIVVSTASLFTTATQSIRRTGVLAATNAAIDTDISRMRELIERYTYCSGSWTISPGSPCNTSAYSFGNSYYYFPAVSSDKAAFFAACEASNPNSHLTASLINSMQALTPAPTNDVTRSVVRVAPSDASNHLIRVSYSSSKVSRQILMRPVVSSWCR